ncbi:Zinc finger protein ZAT11 [Morella rubra]|uniref:Zinc finger protein ZAT11 n=1 Tax=Morella rubra TaxID=262757 RepID=A0A6A1WHW7_9ROSI|nr:Zinc finger protein ZAT11 [Morella rubra]KAB1224026.1 Zinc finger protein ZAT11 [Morella rubra]
MATKRMRQDGGINENIDTANYLMLLSHGPRKSSRVDVFECKTCNRQFQSFQALGGHRASHKRPRVMGDQEQRDRTKSQNSGNKRPKMHECSICGLEFAMGQALGGHMRRHRANEGLSSIPNIDAKVPVLKRSTSTRVMCLDLNLTPLENDLKLLFGKMAPKVDLRLMF